MRVYLRDIDIRGLPMESGRWYQAPTAAAIVWRMAMNPFNHDPNVDEYMAGVAKGY